MQYISSIIAHVAVMVAFHTLKTGAMQWYISNVVTLNLLRAYNYREAHIG